ncbi:MAG: ThiF family adenylyltransferase [Chloroflexi bacterium]|nr:ThiF family adenylyltransferase [Chloroflexota bacterium]
MDNHKGVIIVGGGGIGSSLFQDLCRFLPHTIDIHLMDGDTVEGKNIQRQMYSRRDLGSNKAEALAAKATTALGLDRVYFHPHYLSAPRQLQRIAKHYRQAILVGAVDNHPARRVLEAFVRQSAEKIYYIDCANEEQRGEVVVVYGDRTEVSGYFRSELDPSVVTDKQGDRMHPSCAQQLDDGNLQTLFTNRKAAIITLELISAFLHGEIRVGMVYFKECQVRRWMSVSGF